MNRHNATSNADALPEKSTGRMTMTVVMPALNEERNIAAAMESTLDAFDALGIEGTLIVVNDGSTDRTAGIISAYMKKDSRVSMLTHDRPHGIGASFWHGIQSSGNDVVTMLPGDNENDPRDALRYMDLLAHVDIVVPFIYNRGSRGFLRQVLSFIYRTIINLSFMTNLNYTNGTVLYRRSILSSLELRSKGFFYQTELLVKTIRAGYLFAEVPSALKKRESGSSKAVTLRSLINVIASYCRLLKTVYFSRTGGPHALDKHSATYARSKEM